MTTDGDVAGGPVDWAERCTAEMAASGVAYIEHVEGAQVWRRGAYYGFVCGHPFPPFNGVMATGVGAVSDLDACLDRVAASGLPHLLRMRHGRDPAADRRLIERGYVLAETDPAMVLADAAALEVPAVPGLVVDRVRGEAGLAEHLDVVCDAFGSPLELTAAVVSPSLMADPAARFYVGRVEGQPVSTGASYRTGDSVGIYSVGTPIALRNNGYGAAITARAVADGVADGASWAYLMSSPLGLGVYGRLGFRTVDRWDLWTLPDAG